MLNIVSSRYWRMVHIAWSARMMLTYFSASNFWSNRWILNHYLLIWIVNNDVVLSQKWTTSLRLSWWRLCHPRWITLIHICILNSLNVINSHFIHIRLNLREEMRTQMWISNCGLLFDSFSLTFYFVSNVDGSTCSDELFTLFVDVVVALVFLVGVNHRIDVDETFELLKIVQIYPLRFIFTRVKIQTSFSSWTSQSNQLMLHWTLYFWDL